MSTCPLCFTERARPQGDAHGRPTFACPVCGLIFVPPSFHPDPRTERMRYETHNNEPNDDGYRAFLSRVSKPLIERIDAPAKGLDYGAGPGPTLSVMLEEQGFDVEIYDPFFAPESNVLERTYDFITCTETAEHFHSPRAEFDRLYRCLRPGGWLAVMTEWADNKDFQRWSYSRDVTHVCFYTRETMAWIADCFGYRLDIPRQNVALYQKPA